CSPGRGLIAASARNVRLLHGRRSRYYQASTSPRVMNGRFRPSQFFVPTDTPPGVIMNRFQLSANKLCGFVVFAIAASFVQPGMGQTAAPQDIPIGVTYICNGEHIYVENCNIRDTADTSNCMVAHPDHLTPTGMNSYTYVSRGALKKLLPTCQQPTAKRLAAAKAFQQKQQDLYNANVQKAEQQMKAPPQTAYQTGSGGQIAPPKNAEEREMRRCVSSGRLPSSCTGNSLLGMFSGVLSKVLPGADKKPRYNNQPLVWLQGVRVNAGSNSITLDAYNAAIVN
ncbi:MAG: hypothetical protein WA354_20075, partial [Terracidiphilus sp.]